MAESERKRLFLMSDVAVEVGNYEERPMFPDDVDPQFHVSKNTVPQPFYLVCADDHVLVQMRGRARVWFAVGSVRYEDLEVGDFLYVPAGMPHRIVPHTPSVHYRIKAAHPQREAVVWFCEGCGAELHYVGWDTEDTHSAYRRAVEELNASTDARTCSDCGRVADPVDVSAMAWAP